MGKKVPSSICSPNYFSDKMILHHRETKEKPTEKLKAKSLWSKIDCWVLHTKQSTGSEINSREDAQFSQIGENS